MAVITGSVKNYSGKWYPRTTIRASQRNKYVPLQILHASDPPVILGVVWVLKSSLVGAEGSTYTIADDAAITLAYT